MDYARVYREFIADRQGKQPKRPDYFEKHHIVPRTLGGSDDKSNLVRLTPEDHFFAHLLLAKIHGGGQWLSVWCMVKMLRAPERKSALSLFSKKRMFAVARRLSAAHKSKTLTGTKYRERRPVFTIRNIDGRAFTGPLIDLVELAEVSIASLSRLANKKQGKTYDGWYMYFDEYEKSCASKSANGVRTAGSVCGKNRRQVKCIETGRIFPSITAASAQLGISVKNAFKQGRSKAGGFSWAYVG